MKKFQGVFGNRSIGENNKKRGGIEMSKKRRSSVVGVDCSKKTQEGEKNMFNKVKGLFGGKVSEGTKNKEENNMFNGIKEKLINLDAAVYGVAHTVGFMVGLNTAEYKAGYQEAVSKQAEDTSVEPLETAEPVVEKEEMDMDTFLEKVNTFFDDVKDELNEEVVADELVIEIKVERAKQTKTEELAQLKDNLANWGVKPEDVERKVDAFLHQVMKEDIENSSPSLALKAGRLTGLLTRKAKGLGAVVTSKVKALGEGTETYLNDTSYFNLFFDVTKKAVAFTLGSILVALPLNAIGLGALAGWVVTPAAMVIGLYPIIVAISLFSKASVDSSALVERKVREAVASSYLNRKED